MGVGTVTTTSSAAIFPPAFVTPSMPVDFNWQNGQFQGYSYTTADTFQMQESNCGAIWRPTDGRRRTTLADELAKEFGFPQWSLSAASAFGTPAMLAPIFGLPAAVNGAIQGPMAKGTTPMVHPAKKLSRVNKPIKRASDIKNLLIIVAMDVERDGLLKNVDHDTETISSKLGISMDRFIVGEHNIMVAKSGIGLVNASLTLALISEKYNVDAVLVTGVGGALDPKLNIGDVVISERVLQHDSVYTGGDGDELMASGELFLSLPKHQRSDPLIDAEPVLVDWFMSMFRRISGYKHAVYKGTVLSGSEFVASYRRKKKIANLNDNSLLVDMESAAIAQTARKLRLPFVVVKVVIDRIKPNRSISSDYKRFLSAASENVGVILRELMNTFGKK